MRSVFRVSRRRVGNPKLETQLSGIVPEISAKLEKMAALSRDAATERKFEDVVKLAELVLVY